MQLRVLKISNIGPFPYVPNLNQIEGIRFHTSSQGVTNIIIGPNGSGKSTILEIINQIFKAGLQWDYVYEKEKMPQEQQKIKGNQKDVKAENVSQSYFSKNNLLVPIRHISHTFNNLEKHFAYPNKPSAVYLEFELFPKDKEYLRFVATHVEDINRIIRTYSNLDIRLDSIDPREFENIKTFGIYCTFDFTQKKIVVRKKNMNPVRKFLFDYLTHHELIQICIHIHNKYEVAVCIKQESNNTFFKHDNKSNHGEKLAFASNNKQKDDSFDTFTIQDTSYWSSLKSPFAILGSNRTFSSQFAFQRSYTDVELDQRITFASTKTSNIGELGYLLCRKKFRDIIRKAGGDINQLFVHPTFVQIQEIVKKYTGLTLAVTYQKDKVSIACRNKQGYLLELDQLSSGEESFLLLILTVFGYDLYNGLMIIDEPELHLHPQTQQAFITLIERLEETFCLQFIIATHAPLLITPRTVYHVIRCTKKNTATYVYNCNLVPTTNEANLIHILTYGNIAKMFFAEKIIMVEGETDEYFWRHYLQYMKDKLGKQDMIKNYEIINIGGKGSFKKRKYFLTKFGIDAYYIGDWDNILESTGDTNIYQYKKIILQNYKQEKRFEKTFKKETENLISTNTAPIENSQKYSSSAISNKTLSFDFYATPHKTQIYTKLIAYLHDHQHETRRRLMNKIQELKTDNVFLLAYGDLESYLGLTQKGLEPTVAFCKNNFEKRIQNPTYEKQKKDLENIISCIFGSS